jgi:UDP-N-acetylmuramate: L-alanyl-gamma-D-glutamyl-meso-diaminopimelate ligase
MSGKKVHIIGIAGNLSAPLAKAFLKMGWKVSGSDHPYVYPPATDYLDSLAINWSKGYHKENISSDLDLVVIAGSALLFDPQNPEYLEARRLGLKIISQAEAIGKFVVKKNSIVVAGTYGKSTTTAMLVKIFEKGGKRPSFMFGALPLDDSDPLRIRKSAWSIVEGDEYPTLHFDPRPKFFLYSPKFLILTAARWEHKDVYRSESDYLKVFRQLLKIVPQDGQVVASLSGENVLFLTKNIKPKKGYYSLKQQPESFWWAEKVELCRNGSRFYLNGRNLKRQIKIKLKVLGRHNIENAIAAAALSLSLGVSPEAIRLGLESFAGLRKRLEIIGNFRGITLVKDVSQTKPRIQAALRALKEHFPDGRLVVVFYPHHSGLQERSSLPDYPGTFDLADEVVVTKVVFRKNIPSNERVLGKDIVSFVSKTQPNVSYIPLDEEVVDYLTKCLRKQDVVVFMSSGGYRQIIERLIVEITKTGKKND